MPSVVSGVEALIKLLERARAAPLCRVRIAGIAAMPPRSIARRLIGFRPVESATGEDIVILSSWTVIVFSLTQQRTPAIAQLHSRTLSMKQKASQIAKPWRYQIDRIQPPSPTISDCTRSRHPKKHPPGGGYFKTMGSRPNQDRRRLMAPMPKRPIPSRAKVPGSGTDVDEPPQILTFEIAPCWGQKAVKFI